MPNLAVTSPGHAQFQGTQFRELRVLPVETYILAHNIRYYRDPYEMMMMILIMMMMMMMMVVVIRASKGYCSEL